MKQLTEDLFAVEVPEDSRNYIIYKCGRPDSLGNNNFANGSYNELWCDTKERKSVSLDSFDCGSYEIIGTVTADEIDFDFGHYVECDFLNEDNEKVDTIWYKNYVTGNYGLTITESFRSLLTSKGIHFVNTFGEEPKDTNYEDGVGCLSSLALKMYHIDLKKWQTSENNLVKKIVIIQKVK